MKSTPSQQVIPYDPSIATPIGKELSMGGGIEGAERTKRETFLWKPSYRSADGAINLVKPEADARSLDMAVNDGYSQGAVRLHKDSIVGANYRLNSKPDYRVIVGEDSKYAKDYGEELASVSESRFNLAGESQDCWFDAAGELTFTGLVRLVVGGFVYTGEALATCEWLDGDSSRPFSTAVQLVSPDRLCNKDGMPDTKFLRRGIVKDRRGRPTAFQIRRGNPMDYDGQDGITWDEVPAYLPWGRRQVIFLKDAMQIDQSRGLSDMVAALGHIKMNKTFSEVTLQNAVINASYAAAIESELPNAEVVASMGGGNEGWVGAIGQYMEMLQQYMGGSENIAIDGAKMPHLFPGTKLNLTPMGTPGGIGSDFEDSLLRKIAATLGVSFAELSRNFSKGSYSSAKAEIALAERTMASRKTLVADRFATQVYQLWMEEQFAKGELPMPRGRNRTDFYRPLMKDAYTRCTWIGTGRGQIDELKETQAAILRISSGLSTYEKEAARLGEDFRELFAQRASENALMDSHGLTFTTAANKPPIPLGAGTSTPAADPNAAVNANDNPQGQP